MSFATGFSNDKILLLWYFLSACHVLTSCFLLLLLYTNCFSFIFLLLNLNCYANNDKLNADNVLNIHMQESVARKYHNKKGKMLNHGGGFSYRTCEPLNHVVQYLESSSLSFALSCCTDNLSIKCFILLSYLPLYHYDMIHSFASNLKMTIYLKLIAGCNHSHSGAQFRFKKTDNPFFFC